jgi:hypothetical protein
MNLNDVKKYKCDDKSLYENPILLSSINLLLDLPDVVNRIKGSKYDSAKGEVLTSAGNDYSDITILPGSKGLVDWVTSKLLENSPKPSTSIKYLRTWANKMFYGSEGLVHAHIHPDFNVCHTDFVAIFYVHIPENSAQLIFVDGGEFNTKYTDYDESKLTIMKCESGDLIIHPPTIPHAVTTHNSHTPRLCLLFEGKYV